jgi:hypothetical protein
MEGIPAPISALWNVHCLIDFPKSPVISTMVKHTRNLDDSCAKRSVLLTMDFGTSAFVRIG